MTIDEVEKIYKAITNEGTPCPRYCMLPCDKCVQECKQIVEWLEELKALKNGLNIKCDNLNDALEKGKKIGYNEAIDECLRITIFYKDEWDGIYSVIERIEQLKAGGVNEI